MPLKLKPLRPVKPPLASADTLLTSSLLASVSRSFFLSLRFLPGPVRTPIALAYLLARTSDTLADEATLPLALRLEALEAFEKAALQKTPLSLCARFPELHARNPHEQTLLEHSENLLKHIPLQPAPVQLPLQHVLATIIQGQRSDLTRFAYASPQHPTALPHTDALLAYTYAVAGCVGEFWTHVCSALLPRFATLPLPALLEHGRLFGQGLQLVNILRDLPEDLRNGRCYLPADALAELHLAPEQLLKNPRAARPLLQHWDQQARSWLSHGRMYEAALRGIRLPFSVALPRHLAFLTLDALQTNPALESPVRVKISRPAVFRAAGLCLLSVFFPGFPPRR